MLTVIEGFLAKHKLHTMSLLLARDPESHRKLCEWEYLHEVFDRDYRPERCLTDTSGSNDSKIGADLISHAFCQEISEFGLHVALRMCMRVGIS